MSEKKVITRFAPSPTGHLHIGGARTAIFSWLLARHFKGEFRLRIEDTDTERSKQEYTNSILASMKWLGLDWDGELVYQTKRSERYNEIVEELLANGSAYYCTCTPEEVEKMREEAEAKGEKPRYNGACRHKNLTDSPDAVVRLKRPEIGKVIFDDMVKGKIITDVEELDDMIIRRPKKQGGMPTYNLAVVVDDHDMEISHALRGDDHVSNTPKQILIYQAMNWELPIFGHVPMILGADGQKLSKRNGARAVIEYKQDGVLSETLVNYLVRLGWSHGDTEIFTLKSLISFFDGTNLNASPSRIDPAKLDWLNAHYIKSLPLTEIMIQTGELDCTAVYPLPDNALEYFPIFRERSNNLCELAKQVYAFSKEVIDTIDVHYEEKAQKSLTEESKSLLKELSIVFKKVHGFESSRVDECIHSFTEEKGIKFKQIGPALRCALTGKSTGPSLALISSLLGKEKVLARIEKAILS